MPDADRAAITNLLYTYAERLDAGDLAGVAALFANATFRTDGMPQVVRGSAELLDVYNQTVALYDGSPCTKHVTTNLIIELGPEANTAHTRSYFTVFQARPPELPLQAIIAGRYHDRFARIAGAWRFVDRLIFMDLVGDLSRHLRT